MLKANERSFSFGQKFADTVIVCATWLWVTKFQIHLISLCFPLAFFTFYFFSRMGLYKSQRMKRISEELITVGKSQLLSIIAFSLALISYRGIDFDYQNITNYLALSSICFFMLRIALRISLRTLRKYGKNIRHVTLAGHGKVLESYVETMHNFSDAGIQFNSWIDSNGVNEKWQIKEKGKSLQASLQTDRPDFVIISYPSSETHKIDQLLKENYNDVLPLIVLSDLQFSFLGFQIDTIAGFPALILNQPNYSAIDALSKRLFDFVVSLVSLILLSPLLLLICLLIKLTSKGPIFFSQERIGLDGRRFKMWKFRSMIVNAENQSKWTVENDPRRTKLGTFLRSTSLDELPQLFNVLIGNMSLVGPRPEQPQYVEKFKHEIPAYMLRHKMKAGITGWAQVNGWRGNTSLNKRIEYDLYYVKNWSLGLDIKIILLTAWRGFVNKNAY